MDAVLIGYGSIGKRHATSLERSVSRLVIFDINPQARENARSEHPDAIVPSSFTELWQLDWAWSKALFVIATWGPSHYELFEACARHGAQHVVCEKPLATSLFHGRHMLELAAERGISLGVNHTRRYLGVHTGLKALSEAFELGSPQSIVVHGGASGLVTNGIHFIDLATALFEDFPASVCSTAEGAPINPRSEELMFYGGTAIWTYEHGREAVLSFSNRSSVFPTFSVYFRDAVIDLYHPKHVVIRRRDADEVARHPAVTRTGHAEDVAYSGPLPCVLNSFEDAFERLYEEVVSGVVTTCPPECAYKALEACIGALIAGKSGRRIDLPLNPRSAHGRIVWPIS